MKEIDDIDLQILNYLRESARERVTVISDALGINRVTVAERITKLVKKGIIRNFTVNINYEALGQQVLAFLLISYKRNDELSQERLASTISTIDGVDEVYIMAGEFDILAKIRAKTVRELGEKVVNKIRSYPGVETTISHIVFQTVKG
ncbi:MAG: Lrp/AsnC family transcriptional regulator [Thermoplasmatales archaeon]